MNAGLRWLAAALVGIALTLPRAGRADDDHDHDRARDLYEHGEIRALSDILGMVRNRTAGDIVALDLVHVAGKWVYRFQVIDPAGRRVIVDIDATDDDRAHGR